MVGCGGINLALSKRNKIIYNHIYYLGRGQLNEMGGVYLLGPSEGIIVSNNEIHNISSFGNGGRGLYLDEGSTGIILGKNVVYSCKSSAFHQYYCKENILRNNIFVSQLKSQLEATRVEDHLSFSFTRDIINFDKGILIDKPGWAKVHFFANNNLYWGKRLHDLLFGEQTFEEWKKLTGKDKHSLNEDPMFINSSDNDFHFINNTTISKIKFQPFDYSLAGAYG